MVEDGVQGILTPEDKLQFVAAVLRMLDDEQLRRTYSQRALLRAERFSARNMALELVGAYEDVLAAKRPYDESGRNHVAAME